jgi:hypothetical protein
LSYSCCASSKSDYDFALVCSIYFGVGGTMIAVRCKVCDTGTLIQQKKHRMSGPVVAIGYVLLIPSVLGILFSMLMFFTTASMSHAANDAGSGIAGGIAIFLGLAFFVGGLLGWLLVMKKKVLECSTCGAVINAS